MIREYVPVEAEWTQCRRPRDAQPGLVEVRHRRCREPGPDRVQESAAGHRRRGPGGHRLHRARREREPEQLGEVSGPLPRQELRDIQATYR